MILYFSGTGNSALAAKLLSKSLADDELLPLTSDMLLHPERHSVSPKGDRVIWVFPVYSWGIPPVVVNFMRNVNLTHAAVSASHYMLATCGDDIGYTDRLWRREMRKRGMKACSAFALQMPNTYVCMKGFDVDSPEVVRKKLGDAPHAIEKIARAILSGGEDILIRKTFSWFKTYIIYPGFKKYAMSAKPFHSTDACISCGRCAAFCPMSNIIISAGRPVWSDNCAMCLRCYHICAAHAVAYGSQTASKGQYSEEIKELSS